MGAVATVLSDVLCWELAAPNVKVEVGAPPADCWVPDPNTNPVGALLEAGA